MEFTINSPTTWLLAEILSIILLFICVIHASKQEKPSISLLELAGFVLAAGLFENIGVSVNAYDYNLNRIFLFGKAPFAILFFEAVIVYTGLRLVEHLAVPKWLIPLVVGFFATIQDMTIDPSAVFDTYMVNGVQSGRWNWQCMGYEHGFFGIPFFNFSGWVYLVAYYVAFILIGRWVYSRYEKQKLGAAIGYSYPVIAGFLVPLVLVSPITTFLLFGMPFYPMFQRTPELVMMIINLLIPLLILIFYGRLKIKIDMSKDWVILFVPVVLHLWDILIAVVRNIQIAYFPSIVIGGLHILLLVYYYLSNKKLMVATE